MLLGKLKLPWPPTINTYWRRWGDRMLISKRGRAYRRLVANEVLLQWRGESDPHFRLDVDIVAYPPDRRKRDLDNLPKAVLDSLTRSGVWGDDSQIDRLCIHREDVDREGGYVVVTIKTIDG